MPRLLLAALFIAGFTSVTFASEPVPKESLLTPPENATRYVIVSDTNTHGDEWRWETEDGEIAFRKSQSLRGWITETDALVVMGYDGKPLRIQIRGITPEGNAAEELVNSGFVLRAAEQASLQPFVSENSRRAFRTLT